MSRPLLTPRMAEVVALLDTASAPMSQLQIAAALGIKHKAANALVRKAVSEGLAVVVIKREQIPNRSGTTPNLYGPGDGTPAPWKISTRVHDRQGEALALLTEHPEGLTQIRLAYLTGWNHSIVGTCMVALEASGTVNSTGGTARRPKTYTLLQAGTLPQAAPLSPRLPLPRAQARVRVDLTGELGAARKLVHGLTIKSARGLACAGNYKLSRAEELYAQLIAGGWL